MTEHIVLDEMRRYRAQHVGGIAGKEGPPGDYSIDPPFRRAYSVLTVKALDEDKRIIEGIATSPTPDRVGDIVEPLGVKFKNPIPLLWMHRSSEPVGTVRLSKPTEDGVRFIATLPRKVESENLRKRVDEAWDSIKLGLVRGVSIGFRELEMSFIEGGGIRFIESEVLELSLVTVPANADATIQNIKSFDSQALAASGMSGDAKAKATPAGVTAKRNVVVVRAVEASTMKTISDNIKEFEATRAAKAAEMNKIMADAAEKGSTLDAAQKEKYDDLEVQIAEVDDHLQRLRKQEAVNKAAAVELPAVTNPRVASEARAGVRVQRVSSPLEKGIAFTRIAIAKAISAQDMKPLVDVVKDRWPGWDDGEVTAKAAVVAGTVALTGWAAELAPYQNAQQEFIEYLWPRTILGRIPGLTRVPFRIKVPRQTAVAAVGWVGEAKPKPVGRGTFDTVQLEMYKIAGIVVLSEELIRFSNPSAEALTRMMLANGIIKLMDSDFIDPDKAISAAVSPASITNGVTATTASGTAYSNFVTDVKAVFASFDAAEIDEGLVIVTKTALARSMSLMLNALGQLQFPQLTPDGGSIMGIPVIVSTNVPYTEGSPQEGSPLIFIHAPSILFADDGSVTIDISREASVQMDSAPDNPASASTVLTSFWQHNMVGLRAERMCSWLKGRSAAVQLITAAKYA